MKRKITGEAQVYDVETLTQTVYADDRTGAQYLTDGTRMARAMSVYVSGIDIYVAGRATNAQNTAVATLWKNGTAQNLSSGTDYAVAESVFVSGSDMYVAINDGGTLFSDAKLWRNGTAQFLGSDHSALSSSQANSVFVVK